MYYCVRQDFKKTVLTSMLIAALLPANGWAMLDFATAPPSGSTTGLAPNIILSLDNSGSMNEPVDRNNHDPNAQKRVDLLKDALIKTFGDTSVVPNGKIRLAWQMMVDGKPFGSTYGNPIATPPTPNWFDPHYTPLDSIKSLSAADFTQTYNAMRVFDAKHRQHFLEFIRGGSKNGRPYGFQISNDPWGTPTHKVMRDADWYLRYSDLNPRSPWASNAGTDKAGPPYLGCRRNFHILFTDGGWNDSYEWRNPGNFFSLFGNFDGTDRPLHDGLQYSITNPQTRIYRDPWNTITSVADLALYSWAVPLKTNGLTGTLPLTEDYQKAAPQETFTDKDGNSITLDKYWNPRYDPATWPHLTTYTIGLSKDSIPQKNYNGNTGFEGEKLKKIRYIPGPPSNPTPVPIEEDDIFGDSVADVVPPSSLLPYGFDGDFVKYANGTYIWRALDNRQPPPLPNFKDSFEEKAWRDAHPDLPQPYDSGDKRLDMWHAAINGRGRFYAIERGEQLVDAFRSILNEIYTQTRGGSSGRAASGSNATRTNIGVFVSNYDPNQGWKGWVNAKTFDTNGSLQDAWGGKTTADFLDELSPTPAASTAPLPGSIQNRLILTWSEKPNELPVGGIKGGIPFRWSDNLSESQKNELNLQANGTLDDRGEDRLMYIRGDRRQEGGSNGFRIRQSIQGSIIHSDLWYLGAPASNLTLAGYADFAHTHRNRLPMIYVGGDDGMLHGFSAEDGKEKIAYVPRGVIPKLSRLTNISFDSNHIYYVDGSPMTGDINLGTNRTPNWRTVLVGTLGAGGKGYFVLDVTNPGTKKGSTGNASDFNEANASNLVMIDATTDSDRGLPSYTDCRNIELNPTKGKATAEPCYAALDIGHIFGKPVMDSVDSHNTVQIALLNNNRWAAIMGNGYNSKGERPVLLIQYLDGDKKLLRLVATGDNPTGHPDTHTKDNGLSAPRPFDVNSDGRPDVVYAGDLQGNLWKFLITDNNDQHWGPAKWGTNAASTTNDDTIGVPLFVAKHFTSSADHQGTLQPITIAPSVLPSNRRKTVTNPQGVSRIVPLGGVMVAFGTGRNVTKDDPSDKSTQTLYSVLDNTRYKQVDTGSGATAKIKDRVEVCASFPTTPNDVCGNLVKSADDLPQPVDKSKLAQRLMTKHTVTNDRGISKSFWKLNNSSTHSVNWNEQKGWYLNLPEQGERVLKPLQFYVGSNILAMYSQVPFGAAASNTISSANANSIGPDDSCSSGTSSLRPERQFLTFINILDGNAATEQIIDNITFYNVATEEGSAVRMEIAPGAQTLIQRGDRVINSGKDDSGQDVSYSLSALPGSFIRPSWLQLQ